MNDILFLVVWTIHNIPFVNMVPITPTDGTDETARRHCCWHMAHMMTNRRAALAAGGFKPEPMAVKQLYRVGPREEPFTDVTPEAAVHMVEELRRKKKMAGLPCADDIDPRHKQKLYERPIGNWSGRLSPTLEITHADQPRRRFR